MIPAITFVIQFSPESSFKWSFRESSPSLRLLTPGFSQQLCTQWSWTRYLFLCVRVAFPWQTKQEQTPCFHSVSKHNLWSRDSRAWKRIRFHALKRSRQHFFHQPEEEPELEAQQEPPKGFILKPASSHFIHSSLLFSIFLCVKLYWGASSGARLLNGWLDTTASNSLAFWTFDKTLNKRRIFWFFKIWFDWLNVSRMEE